MALSLNNKLKVVSSALYKNNAQRDDCQFGGNRRQRRSSTVKTRSFFHIWSFYLLVLCMMMQMQQTAPKEMQLLLCKYLRYIEECNATLAETWKAIPANASYCRGEFDGFICWPHGAPNSAVNQQCPSYLDWVNETSDAQAHRWCLSNGSWHQVNDSDRGWIVWDHKSACNPVDEDQYNEESEEIMQEMMMLDALGITYTVGYAVSLVCLVVALVLFTYFKKLHCMRNYIHMNLMISFILRYATVLIKDRVIQAHYDPNRFNDLSESEMRLFCDDFGGVSGFMISCRMVITLMHYAILANYFWLLAEGVYLQVLLSFPMTDCKEDKYFPLFMAGGWGAPWIPVGIWVVLRITLENVGCWEMYETANIWWCLRAPVIISIGINFIIFINIIRIIVMKLRAHNLKRNDYKMTLAKSTLALIPLLGIHYIVFLAITEDVTESISLVMKIKIGFEMVLTSIQGMLIAVFYCFLNGEVRGEVIKSWKNLRLKNGLPSTTFRKSSNYYSNGTQVTAFVTMNSEEKTQVLQDTSFLSPSNRCDSAKSSRRSTMTNNELRVPQKVDGSNLPLRGKTSSFSSNLSLKEDVV